MPGMDGTGPTGQGPMTGRGFGNCKNGQGIGFWCKRGFGFRRFGMQSAGLSKEEEKKILEAEKAEIEKRIKELK